MWWKQRARNAGHFDVDHALEIRLFLCGKEVGNILVVVLSKPVVAGRGDVKDGHVASMDAFPEPLRVEDGGTCFSVSSCQYGSYKGNEKDLQPCTSNQTRENSENSTHPVSGLLVEYYIALTQTPCCDALVS